MASMAEGAVRYYGKWRVVQGVTLHVRRGEVVGLLGPQRRRQDHDVPHDRRGCSGPTRARSLLDGRDITRRAGVPPRALGLGLPGAGAEHLPQAHRARERDGRARDHAAHAAPSARSASRSCWRTSNLTHLARPPARTSSRAASAGASRSRARWSRQPVVPAARRAVRRASIRSRSTEIQDIVGGCARAGSGVLITDHNVRETLNTTDRSYIMFEGRIQLSGFGRGAGRRTRWRARYYLGEGFTL